MRVDVWSDIVCPWCYIGKRRFERAVESWRAEGGEDVEIRWRPFQLDPNAPADAVGMVDALAAKFGGLEAARQAMAHVTEVAAGEGLEYRLADGIRTNTFDAHRVLAFAYQNGGSAVQDAVQERLFRAHFVEGEHLGSADVLDRLAAEVGLERVGKALAAGVEAERVRTELSEGITMGVRSVPTFVIGRRGVAGAQPTEELLNFLRSA